MAGIYKLVFDIALYYILSGYYIYVFARIAPSPAGLPLLAAVCMLNAYLNWRGNDKRVFKTILIALPAAVLAFKPGLWQLLQLLPAWAYIGYCVYTGKSVVKEDDFRDHFGFALRLLLLLLPPLLLCKWIGEALLAIIPYLTVLLVCGVCLLRMLRENTQSGVRQGLYMAAFVAACVLVTVGKAPQMLMTVLGWLYRNVVGVVLLALAVTVGMAFYALFKGLFWLAQLLSNEEPEEINLDLSSAAEDLGLSEEFVDNTRDFPILRYIFYGLATIAVIIVIILIFKRLLGGKNEDDDGKPYTEKSENINASEKKKIFGLTRPRDPRLAVRYYYAKFLKECDKRGVELKPGLTATELAGLCAWAFPGADTQAIVALYHPARYSGLEPVTKEDADAAAAAWHALKRAKLNRE